jgi:UDP-N-acetylglucosamine diphosphorylase/glucosamine-1-phosphate N-acetyltransferase
MAVTLMLFEDASAAHLQPLTLTRPVYDLRLGLTTIREKWERALGLAVGTGPLRRHLAGVFPAVTKKQRTSPAVWINARFMPTPGLVAAIRRRADGHIRVGDEVVAAWSTAEQTAAWFEDGRPQPRGAGRRVEPQQLEQLVHAWHLATLTPAAIAADAAACRWAPGPGPRWSPAAVVDRPERLLMHPDAVVEPGAIVVCEEGPVLLAAGARVMAGAMLRGPVAVGPGATVRMGARVYCGTTIGPHCKVGGEVANTVFHSYSNKAHEGYVGNSVFGQWVNLGADTTASNLKMTYGTVKLLDWPTGLEVDSGEQFLGTVMADHCKTGINTMLNTGTVCGVSSIIVGAGFPAREIPSFKWVQPGASVDYRLDKALTDMERMMARRGAALDRPYRRMMEAIFAMGRGGRPVA